MNIKKRVTSFSVSGIKLTLCLLFTTGFLQAEEITPSLSADFQKSEPVFQIAPEEKRFVRSSAGTNQDWRKSPYSHFQGKRVSIQEMWDRAPKDGGITLSQGIMADVLGGFHVGSGTFDFVVKLDPSVKGKPLVTVRDGYMNAYVGTARWELGVNKQGGLYLNTPSVTAEVPNIPLKEWIRITAVWHRDAGIRLFINGQLMTDQWGSERKPSAGSMDSEVLTTADRLVLHVNPRVVVRSLQAYDLPLNPKGVQQLLKHTPLSWDAVEVVPYNKERRMLTKGWNQGSDHYPLLRGEETVVFKQAVISEAKEDLRAAGWLAVSGFWQDSSPWNYHGYYQKKGRDLSFKMDVIPNWMNLATFHENGFKGEIQMEEGRGQPLNLSKGWYSLPIEASAHTVTIHADNGALSRLEFYRITEEAYSPEESSLIYSLQHPTKLTEFKGAQRGTFFSAYLPEDRLLLPASQDHAKYSDQSIQIEAMRDWHIQTPVMDEDFPLDGIWLKFQIKPLKQPLRMQWVVHDPYSPWRESARIEYQLEPNDTGKYQMLLDLRDTLLMKGHNLWITAVWDQDTVIQLGRNQSTLALIRAKDLEATMALWRAWELNSLRDRLERMSEPRPWGSVGAEENSGWWLGVASPPYQRMEDIFKRLLSRFPDDLELKAYHVFTHPASPTEILEKIPLPEREGHPEWAVLLRASLRQYRAFVDYWIDHRQHENGEFGSAYGDDTDLLQDWLDIVFIEGEQERYGESIRRLMKGIIGPFRVNGGRLDPEMKIKAAGSKILDRGLNVRWTDVLHAYEEGINLTPLDFLAHYGDPLAFQRLLDTVARYDGFILTPEKEGMRDIHIQGEEPGKGKGGWYPGTLFINSEYIRGGRERRYAHLLMHPGLVAAWYNNDPQTWSMLEALARGDVARDVSRSSGNEALAHAVFTKTGNVEYLYPIIDHGLWKNKQVLLHGKQNGILYVNTYDRIPSLNRESMLNKLEEDRLKRLSQPLTASLGFGDDRHMKSWLQWKWSGDEEYLLEALRALYKELTAFAPLRTTAEQSADRVSPPKQLISQLYLGGVPSSRNRHHYPDFEVSYEGFGDQFAARVLTNKKEALEVELYSFSSTPLTGKIFVWSLASGAYEIRQIVEEKTNKNVASETILFSKKSLSRGEGISLTLLPGVTQKVRFKQISESVDSEVLPDLALSEQSIKIKKNEIEIPVYNMGVQEIQKVRVQLRNESGEILGEREIDRISGIQNWKLGEEIVRFPLPGLPQGKLYIRVYAPEGVSEITDRNNQIEITQELQKDALSPGSSGAFID